MIAEVRRTAVGVDGVAGIEKCRVRKAGLTYLVDIHVEVKGELPVWRGHEIAHAVVDTLKGEAALNVSDGSCTSSRRPGTTSN
ncbi:MAG: cation transporter dimerization domain-containing protein [Pyrinomonadaceae bacterium]